MWTPDPQEMSNALSVTCEGTRFCFQAPPSDLKRRRYQRYAKSHRTYLGLIAFAIEKSPNKRLTFSQIMDSLEPFVHGERRGLVNNIRVCLSSNDCFVKVPVHPEYPNSKKNFWKVDETRITPKMLRRHFKDMQDTFPHLAPKLKENDDTTEEMHAVHLPPKPRMSSSTNGTVTKFSGPFSIESILKKDSCILPYRGNMGEKANVSPSTNRYASSYFIQEILSVPECHQTLIPTNRMRICRDFSDTAFTRQAIATQSHCATRGHAHSSLRHPQYKYHLNHAQLGV